MKRKRTTGHIRLKRDVRAAIIAAPCVYRFAGNCDGGMTVEHIIPNALRRLHKVVHDDPRYLASACFSHNVRKGTRRLAPMGFDLSTLPGRGWQHWDGGALPEVLR
jgi:hypothetical protein